MSEMPAFRVVKGDPTEEELAALTAVLSAVARPARTVRGELGYARTGFRRGRRG